jgi:hypothetical protein
MFGLFVNYYPVTNLVSNSKLVRSVIGREQQALEHITTFGGDDGFERHRGRDLRDDRRNGLGVVSDFGGDIRPTSASYIHISRASSHPAVEASPERLSDRCAR